MPTDQLKVLGVQIYWPTAQELAAGGIASWLDVTVEVENLTPAPLFVWASHRGYDYDPATKVLALHLAEMPRSLPPNIKMISDHPRAPAQVEVAPTGRVKVRVRFPAHVRRARTRGEGQAGWHEDPIGEIKHVDVDVQYGSEPVGRVRQHESAAEFRARMLAHGHVVHARITPTSPNAAPAQKEQ